MILRGFCASIGFQTSNSGCEGISNCHDGAEDVELHLRCEGAAVHFLRLSGRLRVVLVRLG